jgi:two-component system response regulator GlrR
MLEKKRSAVFETGQAVNNIHIALVEDDRDLSVLLSMILENQGYLVTNFDRGDDFLEYINRDADSIDLVLSDFMLPDIDGLDLYTQTRQIGLSCPYLLMTAYGDFEIAVRATKMGISDYLIKPIKEDILLHKVSSYLEYRSLEEEVLLSRLGKRIVAHSAAMQEILQKLSRLSRSRASILLIGESGTGKEVLSRILHDISPRSSNKFVALNVSAIPDTLFEAEFFGYRKGAFTNAVRDHDGYARMADGGTLFLDELGELSMPSQAKLLRLLEERTVQVLGSQKTYPVDFRLISATNKDLWSMVERGEFRDDLYYRLAVITIQIPALKQRLEDIMPLARHLLRELSVEEDIDVIDFTHDAQEALLAYDWPGNVRELKNRIHEAILASSNQWIEAKHLNLPRINHHSANEQPLSYATAKNNFESNYLTRLLKIAEGNVNRISEISGLSRKAIYDMMKRNNIDPEKFRR